MEGFLGPISHADDAGRQATTWRALHLISLIAVPAAAVLLTAVHYSMTEVWWLASGERMANFEAAAPFQYRLLMPMAVAALHAATSVGVATLFVLMEVVGWILLVVLAEWGLRLFRIGATNLTRRLLAMTVLIPVAVHLILPDLRIMTLFVVDGGSLERGVWHLTDVFHYVYDLPAAIFTLALVLVLYRCVTTLEGRWFTAYLVLFALASLNRETTIFLLPVFFAACYRRIDDRALFKALLIQVAVFAAIQGSVHWLFSGNVNPHANVPGTQYENHLAFNLARLAEPAYLTVFVIRFAAGFYLAVLLLHRYLDPFLARTLLWFGLPFLASTLVFGRIQEHRVMVEVVPLLWLGAVQAVFAYRARRMSPRGDRGKREAVNVVAEPGQVS